MRIRLFVLIRVIQLLVNVCFLMMLLFFKKVRSRIYKISKSSTESKYCACDPHAL